MIKLDFATLAVVLAMMSFIVMATFLILKKMNSLEKGLDLFTIGSSMFFFAFLTAFFRPLLGSYYFFINNIGIIAGGFFLLEGVLIFRGYKKSFVREKILSFIYFIFCVLDFINMKNMHYRLLLHDSFIVPLFLLASFFFIYKIPKEELFISSIFSFCFVFVDSIFIARLILNINGAFNSPEFYTEFMIPFLFFLIIWFMIFIISILLIFSYKTQMRIKKIASTDHLTGLRNRRSFNEKIEFLLKNDCQMLKERYILFLIDLNGFKQLNDKHGHIFGDFILKKMSEKVQEIIKPNDLAGRLGGDEFTILVESPLPKEKIISISEKIRKQIETPFFIKNYEVSLKISIGYSFLADHSDIDTLMHRADISMYKEKIPDRNMSFVKLIPNKNMDNKILFHDEN